METPTFKKLGKAFIEGMSPFIPFSSYESRLFLARRLAGVPGYQYNVDMSKEAFQRQLFTPEELQRIKEEMQHAPGHEYRRNMVFDEKMYLLDVQKIGYVNLENEENNNEQPEWEKAENSLINLMELKCPGELIITEVKEENIKAYLNDLKFNTLSSKDRSLVKMGLHHIKMIENRFTKPIYEASLSFLIFLMEKYYNSNK